jgi:cytochrome c biogenesis protein ResB
MPFYSDDEVWEMTPEQRQVSAGQVLMNMIAEAMAAFWAGKMRDDRRTWLAWRWFNVDDQGRQDIADEQQRSWDRMREIECESTNRRAKSGEDAKSIIVADMGFERERTAPESAAYSANAE